MKQVTLNINENKYSFFLELIKNFDFIKIQEEETEETKEELISNLTQSFKELKLYKEGKLKTISSKELLDEL